MSALPMGLETVIHPSSVIERGAQLGVGVSIGPFCHVGSQAVLQDDVELVSHVSIMGATTIGAGSAIYPQAVLGAPPQNVRHTGGHTTLVIGKNCTIREGVTMHVGTDSSRGTTTVGDNGFFMGFSHVAHDCVVGSNVTFANGAVLAGHVEIGDFVIIGGLTAVHQFVRVGHHAFLGGCSAVLGDVIPYGMVSGNKARLRGFNIVGMKRSGMPRRDIHELREAYRMLFDRTRPLSENIPGVVEKFGSSPLVLDIVEFLTARGKRQFTLPPAGDIANDDDDGEG